MCFRPRSSDQFTSLVTVDIGTMDYYDSAAIKERLYEQIQNYRRIGEVPILTEDFTFREFDGLYKYWFCLLDLFINLYSIFFTRGLQEIYFFNLIYFVSYFFT